MSEDQPGLLFYAFFFLVILIGILSCPSLWM